MNRLYKLRLPNLFLLLSLLSSFLFVTLGWLFGNTVITISSPSMRQAMSQLSQETMLNAMEREIPYLRYQKSTDIYQNKPLSLFLFETMTSLHPTDLRSLLGRELPGLAGYKTEALLVGSNVNLEHYVIESAPPVDVQTPALEEPKKEAKEQEKTAGQETKKAAADAPTRSVLIYNTHNTESWTHVVDMNDPVDDKVNISLVSKRLSEELKKRGIKTVFDNTDHQKILKEKGLPYAFSYAQSLKTVKAAMSQHQDIGYVFDIHRDSPRKEATTVKINGKSYARPFFIIGKRNPHWEKNAKLASQFHQLLEKKYPGLSIGVFTKGEGNGEYNQSVSDNSVLIEIGGIENTLEECYNTASAIADIFADIYFEKDKKVDAPVKNDDKPM